MNTNEKYNLADLVIEHALKSGQIKYRFQYLRTEAQILKSETKKLTVSKSRIRTTYLLVYM